MIEAKTENSSNESIFSDKKTMLTTEIIQPLTETETAPDRAVLTLDCQGYQKGTVSLVS